MTDPTPMDRLRELGLTPDLPREELRLVLAAAVQEVQDRLDALEAARSRRPRIRRERTMTATKLGPRRDCPIEGCDRAVGNGKLMCGPCWSAVPPDLQRRVYRTWRTWLNGRSDAAFEAYSDARAEAIEAV